MCGSRTSWYESRSPVTMTTSIALGRGLRGERRDDVVGLDALDLELLDLERLEHLVDQRQLRPEQVGGLLAARLVLRVELVAVRAAAGRVERDRDVVGLLVGHDLREHRREAVDRVRDRAGLGREVGREREERPVRERVAVEQEQLGHRRHAMTTERQIPGVQMLQWRIGDVVVTSVTELDDGVIPGTAVLRGRHARGDPGRRLAPAAVRRRRRQHPVADPGPDRRVGRAAHRRRHLPGQRQAPDQPVLRRPANAVPRRPHRGGVRARDDRRRRLHAPARRPHRLEHDAGRCGVGPDVPERRATTSRAPTWSTGRPRRRPTATSSATPSARSSTPGWPTSSIRRTRSPTR